MFVNFLHWYIYILPTFGLNLERVRLTNQSEGLKHDAQEQARELMVQQRQKDENQQSLC